LAEPGTARRASVRDAVAEAARAAAASSLDAAARRMLREIGDAGLMRACLGEPERPLRMERFRELVGALATGAPAGLALPCVVHLATFLPLMRRMGGADHAAVVEGAAGGSVVGTIAATDAGSAGSDLLGMTTRVELGSSRLVLHGAKEWITSATFADQLLVVARHRPERHFASFCLVLVPADAPGVSRSPLDSAAMAGAGLGRIVFDEVTLPLTALVGRPGRGFVSFMEQMAAERLAGGIWTAALARRLLERTVRHASGRRIEGRTLWERSSVRQELARAAVEVTLLEALVDRLVSLGERGERLPLAETAALKAALGPLVVRTVERCLHLHGAQGLASESGLLALLEDVMAFGTAGGATETMLDLVASDLARVAHREADR
jgi:citronellyl-CoA dehydrogenase